MKRLIMNDLIAWKQSKRRKPLVLRGARQVGKPWILQNLSMATGKAITTDM